MTRVAAPVLLLTFKITIHWVRGEFWACDCGPTRKPAKLGSMSLGRSGAITGCPRQSLPTSRAGPSTIRPAQPSGSERVFSRICRSVPNGFCPMATVSRNSVALSPILQPLTLQRTLCR